MHLTTAEVSLASVLVGGLIGALGGTFRDRHNERKDHLTRLWEKEIELYESLLLEVGATRSLYRDLRMRYRKETLGSSKIEFPESGLDEITRKRILIQLAMFGRADVRKAHKECNRLLQEVLVGMARLASLFIEQKEITDAKRSQAADYIRDLFRILDAADEAQDYLTDVIRVSVTRIPAAGKRHFPFSGKQKIMLPTSSVESEFWREARAAKSEAAKE